MPARRRAIGHSTSGKSKRDTQDKTGNSKRDGDHGGGGVAGAAAAAAVLTARMPDLQMEYGSDDEGGATMRAHGRALHEQEQEQEQEEDEGEGGQVDDGAQQPPQRIMELVLQYQQVKRKEAEKKKRRQSAGIAEHAIQEFANEAKNSYNRTKRQHATACASLDREVEETAAFLQETARNHTETMSQLQDRARALLEALDEKREQMGMVWDRSHRLQEEMEETFAIFRESARTAVEGKISQLEHYAQTLQAERASNVAQYLPILMASTT